jgi:hypothetical protein
MRVRRAAPLCSRGVSWPDRGRLARAVTLGCVAVATVAILVQLPLTVRKRDRRARELAALTFEDRDFGAGNSILEDKRLVFEARAEIPAHGSYQVVEGTLPIADATDLTLPYAPAFLTSFLMPRRPLPGAPWVICLGCHVAELGHGARVVWSDGAGGSLVRLRT